MQRRPEPPETLAGADRLSPVPTSLPPSNATLEPRPLPSVGVTRLHRYYEPLRHPRRPDPSLAGGRLARATPPPGASRVAAISLFHACRRHYPGGTGRCARRSLPGQCQPSPGCRRVGFRITRFEACSAFTRVAARMVAEPPDAARYIGVLQSKSLPPSTAPIASGWSDSRRAGFAPAGKWRLTTAHGNHKGCSNGDKVVVPPTHGRRTDAAGRSRPENNPDFRIARPSQALLDGRTAKPYRNAVVASVAQLVRAPDCDSGGRRFETDHSPHRRAPARTHTGGRHDGTA